MVRRLALGALTLSLLGFSVPAMAAKVAVVNMQQAMNASSHWKKAAGTIEKQKKSKQTLLETKQKELRERRDSLQAKKAVSAPEATVKEEEALFRDAQQLAQEFMQAQQVLQAKEQNITDQMLKRIELVVRELSLQGDYEFVFETGPEQTPNVVYSGKSVDITDKVISLYRKRYKGKPLEMK